MSAETTSVLAVVAAVIVTELDEKKVYARVTDPTILNMLLILLLSASYWSIFASIIISMWTTFWGKCGGCPYIKHSEYIFFTIGIICYVLMDIVYHSCLYGGGFVSITDGEDYITSQKNLYVAYFVAYITPFFLIIPTLSWVIYSNYIHRDTGTQEVSVTL